MSFSFSSKIIHRSERIGKKKKKHVGRNYIHPPSWSQNAILHTSNGWQNKRKASLCSSGDKSDSFLFLFFLIFKRLMGVSRHWHWILSFNVRSMTWITSQPPRPLLKRWCCFVVVRDRIANLSPNNHLLGIVTCDTHCRFIGRGLFGRLAGMASDDWARVVIVLMMMMMMAETGVWRTTGSMCAGVLYIRNPNARNKSWVLACRVWFTAVC